jgi:NitT/TauT family transport system ATP-binding protein
VGDDRTEGFRVYRHRERMMSLDNTYSEAELREFHARLVRDLERDRPTILYVTHNFQEAIRIADRVCVLSRRPGRVREIIDIPIPRAERARPERHAEIAVLGERLWSLIKEEAIVADRELVAHV